MKCNSQPRAVLLLSLLPLALCLATACSWTSYREIETIPLSKGQVWRGISEVANTGGWPSDPAVTDEGLGIYQSRWRIRGMSMGHAGRSRLRVEIEPIADPDKGWTVFYYIERQLVDDPRRALDPVESDWRDDGRDAQREEIWVARLRIRLGMGLQATGAPGTIR